MNLIESLKNLGLNEKEARVYLALLQLGRSTAYSVAVRSGLKKPTTYVILHQLIEKGFALNVPRVKKQLFLAEAPEKCFAIAKEKITLSEASIPELLAIRKGKKIKTNVAYFEEFSGVKQAYEFVIKVMKEKPIEQREYVAFFAHAADADEELFRYFDEINEMHKKHKIRRRGVTVYSSLIIEKYLTEDFIKNYSVKIKALDPKKYFSNLEIMIFDKYVIILSQKYLQAVLIENPEASFVFQQIFEMVWELVEKDRENYLKFSSVDANVL